MQSFYELVRSAYVGALEYGGDHDEAFETALEVVDEAEPLLDCEDARHLAADIISDVTIDPAMIGSKSLPQRRSLA